MSSHDAPGAITSLRTSHGMIVRLGQANVRWYVWCAWVAGAVLGMWAGMLTSARIIDRLMPPLPTGGFAALGAIVRLVPVFLVTMPATVGVLQGVAVWLLFGQRRTVFEWCCASVAPALVFATLLFTFGLSGQILLIGCGLGVIVNAAQGYALSHNLGYALYWGAACLMTLFFSVYMISLVANFIPSGELLFTCWGTIYGALTAAVFLTLIGADQA